MTDAVARAIATAVMGLIANSAYAAEAPSALRPGRAEPAAVVAAWGDDDVIDTQRRAALEMVRLRLWTPPAPMSGS